MNTEQAISAGTAALEAGYMLGFPDIKIGTQVKCNFKIASSFQKISRGGITIHKRGRTDERDVAHNYHNCCPSQEFFLFMAIAMAEAPPPNLLAIPAVEIPASRLKSHAISGKDSRSRRFRYLADSRKKMLAVLVIPKNRGSLDAANHHMMKGPGCIQSSRHTHPLPK